MKDKISGRKIKKRILELLSRKEFENGLEAISEFPPRRSVNPLFGLLYSQDELIKWRAVTAMGKVVTDLADHNMEAARIIMRRLLWNMNEESGGIGWGSAEAMGEIMARHSRLADEYSSILVSYINSEQNFVEYEMLQRGVLWGIGRLALTRPELAKDCASSLLPFMKAGDAVLRGLAAWIAGIIGAASARPLLESLTKDGAEFQFYLEGQLRSVSVGDMARDALSKLSSVDDFSDHGIDSSMVRDYKR